MSLTSHHCPLSDEPGGEPSFDLASPQVKLYLDPMSYRIRAIFEGETIVDAVEPLLLRETGKPGPRPPDQPHA